MTFFFLKNHFLEAHPCPLLLPGVSMPLFIHSVTFSREVVLLPVLTLATLTEKEEQTVFWEHPQNSGVSPVAWSSYKSPWLPHITEPLSFYLRKTVTPLSLGSFAKQGKISDKFLYCCSVDLTLYLTASHFFCLL